MACILGSVIVFVDSTVVNVALPAIQDDLGGGLSLQQWVVDAYLLTLGSLLLVGGSLGDLFGARRLFLIGIASFGLASILCAAAPDGTTLILARGLQGATGAILTPAGLAVIATTFSGEERGAAIGAWTAWTGIAFVIGPLGGGWLVEHASWRWIFLVNVPFAIVTGALVAYAVPRKEPTGARRARVDVIGGVLCALGLAGPVFALIEEPRRGWGDPLILLSFFGGIAVFAVFLWWERRAPQPMLPLRLFARRNFSFANIETLTVYAGLSTLTFFLVLYLQQIAGYSALKSGFALIPITVVMFFLSPRVGRLSMRFGPRLFMGVGPLVAGAALLTFVRLGREVDYWTELLPALLVFSIGLSMIVAPLTATVLADVGENDSGIASGVNNAVARVAGLLGIAVVGALVAGNEQPARPVRLQALDADHRPPRRRRRHRRPRRDQEPPMNATTAAEIVFDHVTKRYPGREQPALDDLSLEIPAGTFCVLVGPSGGGKTTALKMINRLIPFDSGEIRIDGRSILDLPLVELRRGIGYVIQQIGLFPHMTVGDNVGTVPRLLGWDKRRTRTRSLELLELVGLEAGDASRYPSQLSGGQRQRVGLARALAADPPVLLMDEPFGALDPITRLRLQTELKRLHREVGKTVIFVTHDIDEAITMGDRIAILRQGGVLAQYDTPDAILAHPADDFVKEFIGEDRALRRLALRTLNDVPLGPVDGDGPRLPAETSVRNAVSQMLEVHAEQVVVMGADGEELGVFRLDDAGALL